MEVITQETRALRLSRRQAIQNLQHAMINSGLDISVDRCPVRNYWAPGAYAREMFLPADLTVVGKIHRHAHINVISQGHVKVFTEQDGEQEFRAPFTFVSHPGTQRVVQVLEDTVWTTIHVTDKLTEEECVVELTAPTYEDLV